MTNREFFTNIINGTITEDVVEYAKAAIAKMDATNEARKNKPSKTALENAPLLDKIEHEILGDEPVTATAVAETMGISTQKASSLLRQLVACGKAESHDEKVKGKGAVKTYTAAVCDACAVEAE